MTKSPEQLKQEAEALDAARAKRQAYVESVKVAINSAPTDPNVRIVLTHLMNACGFRESPAVMNESLELTNATEYNVGRLSVFHDFRKLMSAETENIIERRAE